MTCPDQAQLQRYHDQELASSQAAQIEAHLQSCVRCRGELIALRQLGDHVANARLTEPDTGVLARLSRSMQHRRERQLRHLTEWMMAAAAAIVLGIFGLWPTMDTVQAEPLLGSVERAMLVGPSDEALPANVVTARLLAADLSIDASNGTHDTGSGSNTP